MNNTIRQIIILKLAQFMSAFIVAHPLNNMQAMYLWYMMKRLMMYTKDFFFLEMPKTILFNFYVYIFSRIHMNY